MVTLIGLLFCRLLSVLALAAGEDDDVADLFGLDYSQIRAPKSIGGE